MQHHDALRLKFFRKDEQWQQEYSDSETVLVTDDFTLATSNNLSCFNHRKSYPLPAES
jgi:hypothetical protein